MRTVAQSHGGSAAVFSDADRGTVFVVDVPIDARPYHLQALFQVITERGFGIQGILNVLVFTLRNIITVPLYCFRYRLVLHTITRPKYMSAERSLAPPWGIAETVSQILKALQALNAPVCCESYAVMQTPRRAATKA